MKIWQPFLLAVLFLATACGSSVESENASWKSNLQSAQAMQTKYPQFKAAIQAALDEAKPAMEAAKKVAEEEAKIEAMSKANSILEQPFLSGLRKFDDRIAAIRKKVVEVKALELSENESRAAREAAYSAEDAMREAQREIQRGANDIVGANTIVQSAVKKLDSAEDFVETVIKSNKKREQAEKKAEKEAKKEAEAEKEAEKEAIADIKCSRCKRMNPHDARECAGCGAPLSKK